MHSKRLLTAAVILPLMYLYIMKLPPLYYAALMALAAALAQWEFYSMYGVKGLMKPAGMALGVLIIAGIYASGQVPGIVALSFLAIAVLRLFAKRSPSASLLEMAPVVVGLLYIPGLLGYQLDLRKAGPEWIIFLYGSIWCSDSLAYYIGKGVGKRKLYPEVSPNKTVEGAAGSVAGGILSAVLIKALLIPSISTAAAALTGGVMGLTAIVGDLVESMFKRDAGAKDSGGLIPGHGGILDKIDGSVFGGPVLYWMLVAIGIIN
jgi:phosphatidate cytidylyltransferase